MDSMIQHNNNSMTLVYAQEELPTNINKSIFFAGPTLRGESDNISWRETALQILTYLNYDGTVFIPEPREGKFENFEYDKQVEWEEKCLNVADIIFFYIPRDLDILPGFTTNIEFGVWQKTGKVILCFPVDAPKMDYIKYYGNKYNVPTSNNLLIGLTDCVKSLGDGAYRVGGEINIPLHIWKLPQFQDWYSTHKANGNKIEDAKIVWEFRIINNTKTFLFILWTKIWIQAESRFKENEFFISRPDISACVLYHKPVGANLMDIELLIVKEFRTPVNNTESMVNELTGGSSINFDENSLQTIVDEIKEETDLEINEERIVYKGSRQIYSTLLSHKSHLFMVELNVFEVDAVKLRFGKPSGNIEDSERTYPQIVKLQDLFINNENMDWSNLGMILYSLLS